MSNSSQNSDEPEVEYGFSIDESEPDFQVCLNKVEKSLIKSEKIQKLIDSIRELGCDIPDSFIACRFVAD